MQPYVCIHAPRKEWRNRLPVKISLIMAASRKEALEKFHPMHPKERSTAHYNKPCVIDELQTPYYLD